MKKKFSILLLICCSVLLSACTANVTGKFDDYNEVFKGKIYLDMQGHGRIQVTTSPSNITCNGRGWITYIPASSYILGTCKGQQGMAEMSCSDGRNITGEWTCEACTRIRGTAKSNNNESITFYITPSLKKANENLNNYITDVMHKPYIYNSNTNNFKNNLF